MSQTIFLSAVTSEFGMLRKRLARLLERTKRVHVRHQDDFPNRGVDTLKLLEEEIQQSEVVVHLMGAESGWQIPAEQADALLEHHPRFETQFPEVAAQAREGLLPATQWEAWLALFFKVARLSNYELKGCVTADDLQNQHALRLRALNKFPTVVTDEIDLYDEIVLSLVELGIISQKEAEYSPIKLPYFDRQLFHRSRLSAEPTAREP